MEFQLLVGCSMLQSKADQIRNKSKCSDRMFNHFALS